MKRGRGVGAALGIVADQLFGEPPEAIHPVAAFGRLMLRTERRLYADNVLAGAVHAGMGVAVGALAGGLVRSTTVATWSAVAGRGLGRAATDIGRHLEAGDLEAARTALPTLVGRDPTQLDAKDIARAVVESVAENTVDAVVAPALWAAAAGPSGVLVHRAINTMDAMVGHRDDRYARFGTVAARLDDTAAWVPARVTAALVATCRPSSAGEVWTAVRRDAPAHPSPNSGVAEAAFAAALGLRLGGESRYGDRTELRPPLGDGRPPEPTDIASAVRLSRDVSLVLAGLLAAADVLGGRP